MTNRVTKLLAALVAGTVVSAPTFAEDVTGSAGADITSAYIFRGGTVNDDMNVQPYIEASAYGVTVGTWANLNTDASQMDEIDYYISYDIPMSEDSPAGISLGYCEYTFPTGTEDADPVTGATPALEADREVSVTLSADAPLSPSLFVGYGLEHDLDVTEDLAVSLGAALGYEAGDNFAENGFSHLTLSLGTGYGPFSFSLNYVVETDDDVLAVDEDFYFTIGASL
jgi:uncharacterized protein (TIGR02001 family)